MPGVTIQKRKTSVYLEESETGTYLQVTWLHVANLAFPPADGFVE